MAKLSQLNLALRGSFAEAIAAARHQSIEEMVARTTEDPDVLPEFDPKVLPSKMPFVDAKR